MLRHFVQRLARELTAFLFRFSVGIVRCPVDVGGHLPTEGGFDTAHIGFINVNPIADKVVMSAANSTSRIGTAVTATDFGNFVFEVSIEQRDTRIEVVAVIPQQTDLFAQAFFWFQIRVADNDTVQTTATGHLPPACG